MVHKSKCMQSRIFRGVINGKAGKTAAFPKFSDMITLSQSGGGGGGVDYAQPLALPQQKCDYLRPDDVMFIMPLLPTLHNLYSFDIASYLW